MAGASPVSLWDLASPWQLGLPADQPLQVQPTLLSREGIDLLKSGEDALCHLPHQLDDFECPSSCKYLQPALGKGICSFECVSDCDGDGHLLFPDTEQNICTRCPTPGCMQCSDEDSCEQCFMSWAYEFSEGGKTCVLKIWRIAGLVMTTLLLPVFVAMAWWISLHIRPLINDDVRARAVIHADRLKLRDHGRHSHNWYPLNVSLLRPDSRGHSIGGAGLTLHFRFQVAAMIWTVIGGLAWLLIYSFVTGVTDCIECGSSLALDGPQVYKWCSIPTPEVVQKRRQRVEAEAVLLAYSAVFYVITTVGALVFASHQTAFFGRSSARGATMQEYALFLEGFPEEDGALVEEEREQFVREACGCQPVGVSVCWNYAEHEDEVKELLRADALLRQRALSRDSIRAADLRGARSFRRGPAGPAMDDSDEEARSSRQVCWRSCRDSAIQKLSRLDPLFLPGMSRNDASPSDLQERAQAILNVVQSTEHTCAVFHSAQDRNRALDYFKRQGPLTMFKGRYRIRVSGLEKDAEPDTVLWNFIGTTVADRRRRVVLSLLELLLAIGLWAVFLYVPWSYYVAMHMETFGQLPTAFAECVFSGLVVLGNQLMYILCRRAANAVAFTHTGHQEALYVILYFIAILVNFVVDMTVIRWTSLTVLHQFDSQVPPESVRHFVSYRLWKYNFPSCFLLPFMVEPFILYILPSATVSRVIGSREMEQMEADEMLQPAYMELSRYQDILLNMAQTVVALFLEPSYFLRTWLGLLVGQLFIFSWDHFRVLRVVRAFNFSSFVPERVSQRLTALPCGLLAGCVYFRHHVLRMVQDQAGYREVDAKEAVRSCVPWLLLVMSCHMVVHLIALRHLAPVQNAKGTDEVPKETYQDIATERPANYFNTNPLHCLRSRFLHNHNPPCLFYARGKEHLLEQNPSLGQFYRARRWDDKRKTLAVEMSSVVAKSFCRSFKVERRSTVECDTLGVPDDPVLHSGRLWKMCQRNTKLYMAERLKHPFLDDVSVPPAATPSSSVDSSAVHMGSERPKSHWGGLVDGALPWKTLLGWRLRFFVFKDEGEGWAELAYRSMKDDRELTACHLNRRDTSLHVQLCPRLELEHVDPASAKQLRLQLAACGDGRASSGSVKPEQVDLPTELHPMAISWSDGHGVCHNVIVAHESEERCDQWFRFLRSYCGTVY